MMGNREQLPPEVKTEVLRRDGYRCQFKKCGNRQRKSKRRRLEAHHIVPHSWGGSIDLKNLVTLCVTHHKLVDALLGLYTPKEKRVWSQEGVEKYLERKGRKLKCNQPTS